MFQILLGGGAPKYGTELVRNGTFTSSANWVVPVGWAITGGQAVHSSGIGVMQGDMHAGADNNDVEVTYTLSNFVGTGGVYISLGGVHTTTRKTNGTFTEVISVGTTSTVNINPTLTGDTYKIDNLSIKVKYF
jgi:hypothetical protein